MPEEPAKQEELPSIQIPEDVIEDEDVTMHLTKAQKRSFLILSRSREWSSSSVRC